MASFKRGSVKCRAECRGMHSNLPCDQGEAVSAYPGGLMRGIPRFLAVVLLMTGLFAGTRACAQGGATGAISGVVVDTSGASIADADVQIFDARTDSLARRLPTAPDGTFVATLVPPGRYYAVVNKAGFSQAKADGIEVRVTETTRVTI